MIYTVANEITYQKHYLPLSREELVAKVQAAVKPKRFAHILRVEETALKLAKANGVDPEAASVAALCHDYAKQRPDEDFLAVIRVKHLDPQLLTAGNAIWHGVVGAEMAKDELGVQNEDILNAIRHHTTGAPYMTPLAQVIYMADYIEPGRDFAGVEWARKVTNKNLAWGVALQTKQTLAYLIAQGKPVYPATIDTYNAWVPQYQKEIQNGK